MNDVSSLREHLKAHGLTPRATRHTEASRSKKSPGVRVCWHTVTLTWPEGRITRHSAPDSLLLAYRAACAATVGLPEPVPGLIAVPAAALPPAGLTPRARPAQAPTSQQPTLF